MQQKAFSLTSILNKFIKNYTNLAKKDVLVMLFVCLIRHDKVICIYIFIQMREHYFRVLSANVIKEEI